MPPAAAGALASTAETQGPGMPPGAARHHAQPSGKAKGGVRPSVDDASAGPPGNKPRGSQIARPPGITFPLPWGTPLRSPRHQAAPPKGPWPLSPTSPAPPAPGSPHAAADLCCGEGRPPHTNADVLACTLHRTSPGRPRELLTATLGRRAEKKEEQGHQRLPPGHSPPRNKPRAAPWPHGSRGPSSHRCGGLHRDPRGTRQDQPEGSWGLSHPSQGPPTPRGLTHPSLPPTQHRPPPHANAGVLACAAGARHVLGSCSAPRSAAAQSKGGEKASAAAASTRALNKSPQLPLHQCPETARGPPHTLPQADDGAGPHASPLAATSTPSLRPGQPASTPARTQNSTTPRATLTMASATGANCPARGTSAQPQTHPPPTGTPTSMAQGPRAGTSPCSETRTLLRPQPHLASALQHSTFALAEKFSAAPPLLLHA